MSSAVQLLQLGGLYLEDGKGQGLRKRFVHRLFNLLTRWRVLQVFPRCNADAASAFEQFLERYRQSTGAKPVLVICGNATSSGENADLAKYKQYRDVVLRPRSQFIVDLPGQNDVLANAALSDVFDSDRSKFLLTERHMICMHTLPSQHSRPTKTDIGGRYKSEDLGRVAFHIKQFDEEARERSLRAVHLLVTFDSPRLKFAEGNFDPESGRHLLKFCLHHGIPGILSKTGNFPKTLTFPSRDEPPWPPVVPCPDAFVNAANYPGTFVIHEFEDAEPARLHWGIRLVQLSSPPYRFAPASAVYAETLL